MVSHLVPDILKCEVKWALGSITTNKVSEGERILTELFQILKDDSMKVLHSIYQLGKFSSGHRTRKGQLLFQSQRKAMQKNAQTTPQDWKRSAFIPITKKSNAKECSNYRTIALISYTSRVMFKNYHTIVLISHAGKIMLKILQVRLQQYMN